MTVPSTVAPWLTTSPIANVPTAWVYTIELPTIATTAPLADDDWFVIVTPMASDAGLVSVTSWIVAALGLGRPS